MRFILLLIALLASASAVAAPLPQLSFEQGNTVILNPSVSSITLRSVAVKSVRLQLFKVPDETAENQITTARIAQSISENGLLARVIENRTPQWQADFILPNDANTVTQGVPLMAAAGQLAGGDYVLVAKTGTLRVVQWFSISSIKLVHNVIASGEAQSVIVDANTHIPVSNAVVLALNDKGEVIGGARAGDNGMAQWVVPADAVALRAERDGGDVRPHVFLPILIKNEINDKKNKPQKLTIEPNFVNAVTPAGTTATFKLKLKDGAEYTINYVFAQEQMRYEWKRAADGFWQYRTISMPSPLQRGAVMTDNKGEATVALPVGEGRYRLSASAAGVKSIVVFTAGWWRSFPSQTVTCEQQQDRVVACSEKR